MVEPSRVQLGCPNAIVCVDAFVVSSCLVLSCGFLPRCIFLSQFDSIEKLCTCLGAYVFFS